MQRGTFQWMKSLNKSIILNKIRMAGPISRAQIAKETKLTPPTVGSIVKELIDQGIVKESSLGVSQGGRKPTMLMINSSEFYVIGIDVGPRTIEFVLSDLSGELVAIETNKVTENITNEQFLCLLKDGISNILTEYAYLGDQVVGIGVAMHGVVDVDAGVSLLAPNLHLRDVPIKQELETTFELLVKVENDARAMALAEAWFGNEEPTKSMVAINIGTGVGAGFVIDGKLYHGDFDLAGEIGHMTIDINGKTCECGNQGCLQTVVSGPAIAKKAKQALESGAVSELSNTLGEKGTHITGESVYQAALNEDKLATEVLDETGKYIGVGITNLIHVLNPSKVIIGGGVSRAGKFILNPILTTIRKRALTNQAKQTKVVISKLGKHSTALGAVALLLVELFHPELD